MTHADALFDRAVRLLDDAADRGSLPSKVQSAVSRRDPEPIIDHLDAMLGRRKGLLVLSIVSLPIFCMQLLLVLTGDPSLLSAASLVRTGASLFFITLIAGLIHRALSKRTENATHALALFKAHRDLPHERNDSPINTPTAAPAA